MQEPGRVCQLTTALVLVQLARGDSVAAMKSFQNSFRCEGFEHSEEARTCNALISTFESGDNKAFQEVLQRPILRTMDNEYLRLMKKLKVEDELKSSEHVGGGAEFVNQEGEEEDEDEDLK
ncbi:unnamed protein product [Anisakis simplex]|uniref:Gamma-soluble NSF attachment protein (inferred by orthology to a human protein) n=1 Tax=Anisakis simplex TaxID=6269 RepID=A0A0M3J1S4_ANISI|nr:unnamed protein product [Anisakis simplex]